MILLYILLLLSGLNCHAMDHKKSPVGRAKSFESLDGAGGQAAQFSDLRDSVEDTKRRLESRRNSQERIDTQRALMAQRMRERSKSFGGFDGEYSNNSGQDQ